MRENEREEDRGLGRLEYCDANVSKCVEPTDHMSVCVRKAPILRPTVKSTLNLTINHYCALDDSLPNRNFVFHNLEHQSLSTVSVFIILSAESCEYDIYMVSCDYYDI